MTPTQAAMLVDLALGATEAVLRHRRLAALTAEEREVALRALQRQSEAGVAEARGQLAAAIAAWREREGQPDPTLRVE